MALLTAPFPQQDPTALARIVLSGMSQLQENLQAQQEISENEQNQVMAQSKIAASNVMNLANIQASQREQARQASQDSFNNMIGLQNLSISQANSTSMNAERNANTLLTMNKVNAPSIASPTAAIGDPVGGAATTAPITDTGSGPQPPSDMANPQGVAPNGGVGGIQASTLLSPDSQARNNLLTTAAAQVSGGGPPAQAANPSSLLMQAAGGVAGGGPPNAAAINPLLMQQPSTAQPVQPAQGDLTDLQAIKQKSADAFKAANGMDYMDALKPEANVTPQQERDAFKIKTLDKQIEQAKTFQPSTAPNTTSTSKSDQPWKLPGGGVDVSKIPADGKKYQIADDKQAERIQNGRASVVQLYQATPKQNVNGKTQTVYVKSGPLMPAMPSSMADTPVPALSTTNKIDAYETAKNWLQKEWPKMSQKDRDATLPQYNQMYQTFLQLSNDPEVQAHTRKVETAQVAIDPDEVVTGHHIDAKSGLWVPTTRKATPDELKSAASQRADIKLVNSQLKDAKTEAEDTSITGVKHDVAMAKYKSLLDVQNSLNSAFMKRAGAPSGAPTSSQSGAPGTKPVSTYFNGQ